jgi:hypothetical protein
MPPALPRGLQKAEAGGPFPAAPARPVERSGEREPAAMETAGARAAAAAAAPPQDVRPPRAPPASPFDAPSFQKQTSSVRVHEYNDAELDSPFGSGATQAPLAGEGKPGSAAT